MTTCSTNISDAAVLAVIEALRAYIRARGHAGFRYDLAEDWYREQLFPPTRDQFRRAVRLMNKTSLGVALS